MDPEKIEKRWDMHSDRQIAAAKGGATAVTILNSGSWLALLSQLDHVRDAAAGLVIACWGAGALLGTLVWLFIYIGTHLQGLHDFDPDNDVLGSRIDKNIAVGVGTGISSLLCFGVGVILLAVSVAQSSVAQP